MSKQQVRSRPKTSSKSKSGSGPRRKAKHASGGGHAGLIVTIVLLVLLIGGYGAAGFYFSQHFLPGTTIGSMNVSFMTLDQAKEMLVDSSKSYKLTLNEQDYNKEVIEGEDVGLNASVTDSFNSLLDMQSGFEWIVNIFGDKHLELGEDMLVYDYDEDMLSEIVDSLQCVSPQYPIEAKNAEIVLIDGKFGVSPESIGNVAHRDDLEEKIKEAIASQTESIDLEKEGLYDLPEIYSDDPGILEQKELYDEMNDLVITLKFGSKSVPIGVKTTAGWLKTGKNEDGSYRINLKTTEITKYVKTLANTYDTYDKTKFFTSHAGNVVEINSGDYGWMLDQEYAVNKIKGFLLNRESPTIDLTDGSEESNEWWYRKAVFYDSEGTGYYGNTYAEVSVAEQHMWMYQDGVVVYETDVVTGNPNLGNDTPKGAFRIRYHQAPATLRGPGYVTQVAYWMVFADDVGFHDATWQPYFGGTLYQTNGSHGCVNLPLNKAAELYGLIYDGMPVFVY